MIDMGQSNLREEFDSRGYVVVPDFLNLDECRIINAALDEHYRLDEMGKGPGLGGKYGCDVVFWNPLAEQHPVFTALLEKPRLHDLTSELLGENYQAGAAYTLVMASLLGGVGQAWHQDCPADNSTHFNLNRLIYTRDLSTEDGAVVVVPGSHRMGRIPKGGEQDPMDGEVTLTPTAGTLVLMNGHVFHRVTPNSSNRPRISINFRALPAGVPSGVCDIGVYRNAAVDWVTGAEQINAQ